MTTAFQSDAFQTNAFQIDASPIVTVVDTHDPGIKHRERFKRKREELRSEITEAFEGVLEPWLAKRIEAEPALAALIEPQKSDSIYKLATQRIDLARVFEDIEAVTVLSKIVEEARREADDDDVTALLLA